MNAPARSLEAWREEGIREYGYTACASVFPRARAPAPGSFDPPAVRSVRSIVEGMTVPAAGSPVQREMPFLAAVAAGPSLSRPKARKVRDAINGHPGLIDRERKVLVDGLLPRCRDDLHAWPRYETIARDTGQSRRTVARAIDGLSAKGAIGIQRRGRSTCKGGRTSNMYGIQLEFFFGKGGTQPEPETGARQDDNREDRATVGSGGTEGKWHSNHELPTERLKSSKRRRAREGQQSTPVRQDEPKAGPVAGFLEKAWAALGRKPPSKA